MANPTWQQKGQGTMMQWKMWGAGTALAAVAAVACVAGPKALDKEEPLGNPMQTAENRPPCPMALEVTCDQLAGTEGQTYQPLCDCACGTGVWVTEQAVASCMPAVPLDESSQNTNLNGTRWLWLRQARSLPGYCEAHVQGAGWSQFWRAGSFTRAAAARYAVIQHERWLGTGVPCPRLVPLAATGGGGLMITLTCSAQPGCAATGSSSVSGACSSLGNANATLDEKNVGGSVAYNEMSHAVTLSGSFGAVIDDSSPSMEGKISKVVEWSLEGAGSASGTASYSVKSDRTYCAFTNKPVIKRATGVAVATAGGTVDENGSSSFDATAFVALECN